MLRSPEVFFSCNKHCRVIYNDKLLGWYLSDIERKPKDVGIGLARVNAAGRAELVDELVQLNLRMRYVFTSRGSLLRTLTCRPGSYLCLAKSLRVLGHGFDWVK